MTPDLTVSVVTYNSAACLPDLLASVCRQTGVRWELRIADNASTDETRLALAHVPQARIALNATNLGFGRAHNRNLAEASGRHFLILNPDVKFADGLFRRLVEELDRQPNTAIAGPSVFEESEGRVFPPRYFYPGEGMCPLEKEMNRTSYRWIHGGCLAIRREAFHRMHGFDEDFFLYSEEIDLCLRLRRAGWEIAWAADAQLLHQGFASLPQAGAYERSQRQFEGMMRFYQKHYPPEEIRGMLRFQLAAMAMWRFWPLSRAAKGPLHPERLRARRDVVRAYLDRAGAHRWPLDGSTPRILARQCEIGWHWLRKGRFPLDDY